MDRMQATDLVSKTFTQRFDEARFTYFIRNLVNHLDESKKQVWTLRKAAFQDYVNHFTRLGTYTDPRGERVDVLVIHLCKETTLARGRVTLRNFVADYLTTGHGQGKAAIIAAFVSPSENDWRFSFIKLDYTLEETELGFITERAQLTPARRYSYLVGEHENCHTAQKQFLELLQTDFSDPTVSALEAAFSVEKVTKEFFEHYRALFERTRSALKKYLKSAPTVAQDFEQRGIEADDFTKKLLGQIVFLYFLQKKGWFGVERGKAWGEGRKDFLRHLFDNRDHYAQTSIPRQRTPNFFNDILEPLFYEALAYPREADDHYYSRFDCRIPFLNGGLFEPLYGYKWVETDILLSDELFSNNELSGNGDVGTGILDIFDRYNFTVNEAEPLENEVAVDPEMLGKVFENLLPENVRHSSGTYYTPRVIVHYMCQQALLHYLSARASDVPSEALALFLRLAERFADFEATDTKVHADKRLPEMISKNADRLDELLASVTVCDPAIGSGAFPVGMMHEIVRARMALTPALEKQGKVNAIERQKKRSAYALKRHAIHHSVYGVDEDPGAVEIAKLRLWLSMVVDEDNISDIQPLPNLDYKIMQGNSLLEEFNGVCLFDERLFHQTDNNTENEKSWIRQRVSELTQEFIRLHSEGRKSASAQLSIKQELKSLNKRLDSLSDTEEQKTVVQGDLTQQASWGSLNRIHQLHAELFETSSRQEKDRLRTELEKMEWAYMRAILREQGHEEALAELELASAKHRKPFFLWKLHFNEVFQQRGGFDVLIANPPFVLVQGENRDVKLYAAFKRLYKVASYKIDLYHLFIERGIQLLRDSGAICYITPSNFVSNNYAVNLRTHLLTQTILDQIVFFDEQVFQASVHNLVFAARKGYSAENRVRFCKATLTDNELTIREIYSAAQPTLTTKQSLLILRESVASEVLLTSMEDVSISLADVADIAFGMQLRDRSKFPTDVIEKPDSADVLTEYHKPCYTGRDISRYKVDYQQRYCYFNREAKRGGCWDDRLHFAKQKLLLRQIGFFPEGGIDPDGYAVLNTAFMVVPKGKEKTAQYLLAVINSPAIRYYWLNRFGDGRKTFPKIKGEYLKLLPIPKADAKQKAVVERLVEYLLWLHRNEASAKAQTGGSGVPLLAGYFEQCINALVYELFFPEQLHGAGLYFFSLTEAAMLKPISEMKGCELTVLRTKFEELFNSKHPLRQSLFALDSLEEVRIIEGKA